ncbi:unnamed protein product, partial [Brenthis ino]
MSSPSRSVGLKRRDLVAVNADGPPNISIPSYGSIGGCDGCGGRNDASNAVIAESSAAAGAGGYLGSTRAVGPRGSDAGEVQAQDVVILSS